ncbi:MAG: NAD-dependent epimerase/dehydratase family protein [Pseudomonadota bacterium]|nr:NAD-dependent epimerase/dehydratase family protein [Pseudomonadota bacterium]
MIHARQKTALIVGATGSFGGHAAAALIKHGWRVRALTRDVAAARAKSGPRMPIEWTRGNAMSGAQVTAAAAGADVIVHAANPPGYRNWRGLAAPMLAATIAAARATGARIVFPGNVYNYAPGAGPCIAEAAPQAPVTRKGRIRVRMEAMLREAACDGVRVLIVRSGDFFGPAAPTSGLGWLTSRRGGRVRCVYAPGPGEVGHAWAYLPDLAEATARLLDREADLTDFEVFHFAGHWLARGDDLAAAARRVTGRPDLPIRPFPWPLIWALSPFVEMFRELLEMRYLWRRPIGLDGGKLAAFLGAPPTTTLDAAVRATLADMDVLEEGAGPIGALAAA